MRRRKGQFEIMGLAIIVVIVMFVILLTLRFMPRADQNSLPSDVADSTIASNLLNVILKTTLDCKDIDLQNLLQDCAKKVTTKDYCEKYADYDHRPCDLAKAIIADPILAKTLTVWKKNYTFMADSDTENLFSITNTLTSKGALACAPGVYSRRFTSLISESFPVPLDNGGQMEISLYICR